MLDEFSKRFTGSSDLYQDDSRRPTASINFITAHDGFTLADLVSYNDKHNEQNGEDNNDGDNHNRSWNCGVEGPTDDEAIIKLRRKQQRNFLTTLFLSIGVPMLTAGDEIGKTQRGNNNAYCQDNEISWINWAEADQELLEFTKHVIKIIKEHPVFCRRKWFQGQKISGVGTEDIAWFKTDGSMMSDEDWQTGFAKSLGVFLNGKGIKSPGPNGEKIIDNNFYIVFNASEENLNYKLPEEKYGNDWLKLVDTEEPNTEDGEVYDPMTEICVHARSMVVLMNQEK